MTLRQERLKKQGGVSDTWKAQGCIIDKEHA